MKSLGAVLSRTPPRDSTKTECSVHGLKEKCEPSSQWFTVKSQWPLCSPRRTPNIPVLIFGALECPHTNQTPFTLSNSRKGESGPYQGVWLQNQSNTWWRAKLYLPGTAWPFTPTPVPHWTWFSASIEPICNSREQHAWFPASVSL